MEGFSVKADRRKIKRNPGSYCPVTKDSINTKVFIKHILNLRPKLCS